MSFPAIDRLVPHRHSMSLVDKVVSYGDGSGVVSAVLDPTKPYFIENRFETVWLVEMMAQAMAAVFGMSSFQSTQPQIGFLIAVDHYQLIQSPSLTSEDPILLKVKNEYQTPPVGIYSIEAWQGNFQLADARMKAVLTDRVVA